MKDNLILKKNLKIYDNQLLLKEITGRLSIQYEVFPAPAIFWEFETFNFQKSLQELFDKPIDQDNIYFSKFSIGKPKDENSRIIFKKGNSISGTVAKVIIGDRNLESDNFSFYLPNSSFQKIEMVGKNFIVKDITYRNNQSQNKFGGNWREGFLKLVISDIYEITLYTPINAIDWLESIRSIGTNLTTEGQLKILNGKIKISEAEEILKNISYLLSFMNGGYIFPLIIKMEAEYTTHNFPVIYTAYAIDPIENLGSTWLCPSSDSKEFLICLDSFRKMLNTKIWDDDFDLILIWYFQAIQSTSIQQRGKSWPVVANALGAALEKLAWIILVGEKKVFSKTKFNKLSIETRIRETLQTIGIDYFESYFFDQNESYKDAIWWFVKMRNDATHPISERNWNADEVDVILNNAVQWVEEILLWRLGYKGIYRDRSRGERFFSKPRYNINKREVSW